jgi:hypothetical protein
MQGRRDAETPAWVVPALLAAMALAAAVLAWEGRNTTWFNGDELQLFTATSWSPRALLTPQNGHLILVSRFLGHATLSLFGDYGVYRALSIVGILAACGAFFAYASRRVGGVLGLAATVPLLFLGSGWEIVLFPIAAIQLGVAIAAGICALLLVENGDARDDVAACALLAVSVASFTVGLCFVLAVAAHLAVQRQGHRLRRAWIVAVPLALWVAWWIWSRQFHDDSPEIANILLVPVNAAAALGDVTASLTGLIRSFDPAPGLIQQPVRTLQWSPLFTVAAAVGLYALARLARPDWRRVLPVAVALATYWAFTALGFGENRHPDVSRYMFPGAVLLLLVAVELGRGLRADRTVLLTIAGVLVLSVVTNVAIMRDAGRFFRDYTTVARSELAMIELAGAAARPDFAPASEVQGGTDGYLPIYAGDYLRGVAEFGGLGYSPDQVATQDEELRSLADTVLAKALGLGLTPALVKPDARGCRRFSWANRRDALKLELPANGAVLRANRPTGVEIARFADRPAVDLGDLAPGKYATLAIPPDSYEKPWRAVLRGAGRIEACPITG